MHMVMVVITDRSRLVSFISTSDFVIVMMFVIMMVVVMAEMLCMARRMFQRTTNSHGCHIRGIQRKHDGKKKGEARAHNLNDLNPMNRC